MKLSCLCILASTSLLSSTAIGGNVLVVAAGGGGDFTSLQAAVDAAVSGDTLLVKTGQYVGPTIVGKQLNVVADSNAKVVVEGSIEVHGLLGGTHVLFAGLHVTGAPNSATTDRYALRVSDSLGSIRVQECELNGAPVTPSQYDLHAVVIENAHDVAIVRSVCTAADFGGGCGVKATSASIALHESALSGGDAFGTTPLSPGNGLPGGDGFDGASSFLFTAGSTFHAGNGSASSSGGQCNYGGNGGSGVSLGDSVGGCEQVICVTSVTSTAIELANVSAGGLGGSDPGGACGLCLNCDLRPGPPGLAYLGESATQHLAGSACTLSARSVAREGTVLTLRFRGTPGDKVSLYVGDAGGFRSDAQWRGVKLVETGAKRLRVGRIEPDGTLTYFLAMPSVPAGSARTMFLQALHESGGGQFTLGSPLNVVVLDAAF